MDRLRAVAREQREMVHLARRAGLDDEAGAACASPLRTRCWCTAAVASSAGIGSRSADTVAVGQDQDVVAQVDRVLGVRARAIASAASMPFAPHAAG